MNRIYTLLAIAGLCCAIVAWQIWHQQQRHTPESVAEVATAAPTAQTQEQTSASAFTPIAVPGEPGDQAAASPDADARNTDSDTEVVLGLRVRKDRDCTLESHFIVDAKTSELIEAYSCEPNNPPEPDPYLSWDEQTLANMAYGDAHAAEVLGLRHIRSEDPDKETLGLSLIFRSVALTGDPQVFRKAIGARYAYLEINGKPQLENLRHQLVFNVIGEILGDRSFNTAQVVHEMRRVNVPQEEIDAIRHGAKNILRYMADLQTEMTGDSTIMEALVDA